MLPVAYAARPDPSGAVLRHPPQQLAVRRGHQARPALGRGGRRELHDQVVAAARRELHPYARHRRHATRALHHEHRRQRPRVAGHPALLRGGDGQRVPQPLKRSAAPVPPPPVRDGTDHIRTVDNQQRPHPGSLAQRTAIPR